MTDLWNALVEIDREHRNAVLAATADDPEVAKATEEYERLQEDGLALVAERAGIRKAVRRRVPTPELDARIKALSEQKATVGTRGKAARREARERAKPTLDEIQASHKAAVKRARQQSGLYWGNYNAVIASYATARSRSLKEGGELRFRPHRDRPEQGRSSARIVNQLQGGATAATAGGGRTARPGRNARVSRGESCMRDGKSTASRSSVCARAMV
jgi:hypothetical protein